MTTLEISDAAITVESKMHFISRNLQVVQLDLFLVIRLIA